VGRAARADKRVRIATTFEFTLLGVLRLPVDAGAALARLGNTARPMVVIAECIELCVTAAGVRCDDVRDAVVVAAAGVTLVVLRRLLDLPDGTTRIFVMWFFMDSMFTRVDFFTLSLALPCAAW
jgi:hypothetical protein